MAWGISASLAAVLMACAEKSSDYFPGYAEAEYVRLASPIAGALVKLHVQRGDRVEADAPAFVLEQDSERAVREAAAARARTARAQLDNLLKGRRPDELAVIRQQLAQAEAALQLSSATLARQRQLVADKFVSPSTLDEARSAEVRDQARVQESRAQLRVARLGARSDEIDAAQQELKAAEAQLAQAEWQVAQKTQRMPAAGVVNDVLYREGEYVQAGSPIISLLPPQNIKARFFVPETAVGALRIGQEVQLQCDGCDAPIPARISFVSNAPEYTSPLIYSTENRAALVFMVEARPAVDDARRLHPGQPVEARLAAQGTR
ncbi:HlyD family efflux transporter periplasmic adaptor subunit [Noviherbaspirillum cavernae]|uniref:HlyD family efflux transporter periplasmic adaptor subunit n=2 Tax=Noviherbaspirillum cavernae TaxID=2320862 RepID=A0A418X5C0_9BURK|nr:HlyD family efflux transporter periplasmic adaptor subunit [Noviherbaspirillum cavernae]